MVLPLASCAADVPADACCSTFFDVADRVRSVAFNALVSCQDPSCADREFRSYVTHGPQVQDPLGDSLVANLVSVAASTGSREASDRLLPVGLFVGRINLHLFETGWPQIEANDAQRTLYVPDSDLVHAMARHSYAHGEKMYRAIVDGIQKRTLFTLPANSHIGQVDLSDLVPMEPGGPIVGWSVGLRVQMTFPPLVS